MLVPAVTLAERTGVTGNMHGHDLAQQSSIRSPVACLSCFSVASQSQCLIESLCEFFFLSALELC